MRKNLGFVLFPQEIKKRQVRVGITWRYLTLQPTRIGYGVSHLTTYGGPLVKGVSIHTMHVKLINEKILKSGG